MITSMTKNFIGTFLGIDPLLNFDRVTGWSRFLKDNARKNVGMREIKDGSYEFYEITEDEE